MHRSIPPSHAHYRASTAHPPTRSYHSYSASLSEFNTLLNTLEHTVSQEYTPETVAPSATTPSPVQHPPAYSCDALYPRSFASMYPHYSHYNHTLLDTTAFDLPRPTPSATAPPPEPSTRCYGNEHYCTMQCIRINGRLCPDKALHYTPDDTDANTPAPPSGPPPLYTSGVENQEGLPGHALFQSKLSPLPYRILQHTGHAVGGAVDNILDVSTTSAWLTTHGAQHELVLELLQPCLLGHVQVHNRASTALEIAIAYQTPRELLPLVRAARDGHDDGVSVDNTAQTRTCKGEAWTTICRDGRMPLGRLISYRTGYLPAKFVKIRFHEGKPVSVNYIRLVGIPCATAEATLGEQDSKLLMDKPLRTLMDMPQPVLRADTRGRTHTFPVGFARKEEPAGERGRYDPHADGVVCIHQL